MSVSDDAKLVARDETGKRSRGPLLLRPRIPVERVFAATKFDTLLSIGR
jgi:hypothetical protein